MTQIFTHKALHGHQRQVNQLLVTMEHLRSITANQALADLPDELAQQIRALRDSQLTLLFTGTNYSERREIINALLEKELLPLYPASLQNVPTVIFGGEEPEAHIHYKPRPDSAKRAIHAIKLDNLENDLPNALATTSKKKDDYECIMLQYSHPLLAMGLTIIDLPCRIIPDREHREHREHRKTSHIQQMMQYIKGADVVMYMRDCSILPTKDEDLLIESIKQVAHPAHFFLCDQIAASNIRDIEVTLASSLTACWQERRNNQIAMLKNDILTAIHLLKQREQVLQGTSDQLDRSTLKMYLDGFERIKDLTLLSERISEPRLQRRTTFTTKFGIVSSAYYERVLQKIDTWTQQYIPEPVIKDKYDYIGNARERFVKGLSVFLGQQIRKEAHAWLMDNCYPLIKEELCAITRCSEKPVEQFIKLQHEFQYALQSSKHGQTCPEPVDVLDRTMWQIAQEQQAGEDAHGIIALIEQNMNINWPITALPGTMLTSIRNAAPTQRRDEQAIRQFVGEHYREMLEATFLEGQRRILAFITEMLDKKQDRLIAQLHLFEKSLHTTVIEQIDAHHSEAPQRQQVLERLEQDIAKLWDMYDEIDEHE